MEILTNLGITILVVIGIIIILSLFFYMYLFVKSAIVLNNVDKQVNKHLESETPYIYFEHYGDTGIGKIYNTASENDKPFYMVCCIFTKTNATQHLELSKIHKYIPVKIIKITEPEITT